jgi:hypothetical protein
MVALLVELFPMTDEAGSLRPKVSNLGGRVSDAGGTGSIAPLAAVRQREEGRDAGFALAAGRKGLVATDFRHPCGGDE